jgi:hypothetical protein
MDYSELTTQIEPLARKLYEHLNRKEWGEAEATSSKLGQLQLDLHIIILRELISSGRGFK